MSRREEASKLNSEKIDPVKRIRPWPQAPGDRHDLGNNDRFRRNPHDRVYVRNSDWRGRSNASRTAAVRPRINREVLCSTLSRCPQCGSNYANISPDGSSSTDTFEFMFLQNMQESDLRLGRKLSDFIVKAPFSWPNNSDAIKSRGTAAQLTLTNTCAAHFRPCGLLTPRCAA
jgi:hypothetical protein